MSGFSTQEDYGYQPIPEGSHVCQITKCFVSKSRAGDDMLCLRHTIVGPNDPDKGATFRQWIVLVPKPYGYGTLQEICTALSVLGSGEDPDGMDPHKQDSARKHLLGRCLVMHTYNEDRTYEDDFGNEKKATDTRPSGCESLPADVKRTFETTYSDTGVPPLPGDHREDFKGVPVVTRDDGDTGAMFDDPDIPF